MHRMEINSHDGTHVNVPRHCVKEGKVIEDYTIDQFMGEALIFYNEDDIQEGVGLIFHHQNIDMSLAKKVAQIRPKFIGLSDQFEWDVPAERFLLKQGIISYERLANTEKLPKKFNFVGVPLLISEGNGSPVRAYAEIE